MSVSKKRVFVQKLAIAALSAGIVVSLSACANGPFAVAACSPIYTPGANSALVSSEGGFSADPAAEFPTPMIADGVESEAISTGDGEQVGNGHIATLQITIYNGETGEQVISTGHDTDGLRVSVAEGAPRFGEIAQCATVGSRITTVGTAGEILGADNIAQNQLPLNDEDTIVMISDVESLFPGKANGADQVAPAGLPAVVLAPNGQPGFTFPGTDAPTELTIAKLKAGSGQTVAEDDLVVMHVSAIEWDAEMTFTNSWEDGGVPGTYPAASSEKSERGLPPGLAEALIGQTVGSQVLVVLPPDVGFAPGTEPEGVASGSTLVFVLDILGIQEQ
ncbi:peptidylprolyl isomerase [Rhodoglobus vestalii]|uniref:peptidylprolyl isomerase n=1 Tax=Rhodoglobus vestalii TaxID=193384 RepID=A0A8H2K639_9MICO|nr:FKBP-type peptidyl-prolyl cis-trans isomerase [Rhodoglobus vestalii]TQO18692.1 peptidylprolyl isomerase [Rhodoglobus vestalii]